jgi:hypothetical protein
MGKKLIAFKKKIGNKVNNLKKNFQNMKSNFKSSFTAIQTRPMSKRKSAFFGFATVAGIFGLTIFGSALSASAKEIPLPSPSNSTPPQPVGLVPAPQYPSPAFIGAVTGAAGTICGLAASSASFVIGAGCGLIIVTIILKVQGK